MIRKKEKSRQSCPRFKQVLAADVDQARFILPQLSTSMAFGLFLGTRTRKTLITIFGVAHDDI